MDTGTWISLGAAVVSLLGGSLAAWQGVSARRAAVAAAQQADATREQAEASKQSLAIQRAQYEQQERDRVIYEAAQARLIMIGLDAPGTLVVTVTNNSSQPVTDVSLEEVCAQGYPNWRWEINANVLPPVSKDLCVLSEHQAHEFPVWFTDEHGQVHRVVQDSYRAVITFTDAANRRWRRAIGEEPQSVLPGDY
jgi:hypothetical protein